MATTEDHSVLECVFIKISPRFTALGSKLILQVPFTTFLCTKWYAIELCFYFNVDSGLVELLTTDTLSLKYVHEHQAKCPSYTET